jgi:Rrf2 family transcriptional regulator, nitric oxide-sensitive transcriptional repressor
MHARMKLQKSSLLALYSVLEFAADPGRQITAAEIAGKYGVSTHHLSKVLRDLGRAGLLESVRGVGGGYRFSGNTKRITLMDVIELFEEISGRPAKGGAGHNGIPGALASVLAEIDETAKSTFRSITLDTMLMLASRMAPERVADHDEPKSAPAAGA